MARRKKGRQRIDLLKVLGILQTHITGALCGAAYRTVRTDQRRRIWTLKRLVEFWNAVILRAPPSLSQALLDVQEGRDAWLPRINATPEAFFERCRDLSWKFFAEVWRRFIASLLPVVRPRYAQPLHPLLKRFTDVLVIDGSRLAAIAHRLKILRDDRSVILPGCLLAIYDVMRGIPRVLDFCVDAAAAEIIRAKAALGSVRRESLIVGDRLYAVAAFFKELRNKGCWGLFRRNRTMHLRRQGNRPLRQRRWAGGTLTEWLVEAGTGVSALAYPLRLIRFKYGRQVFELLTDVMEPQRLSAQEAMELYVRRWSIERMFFDLKEVLNLNRLYPANPNAVAMQVYASAMVYTALRVAQANVAHQANIEPEQISPAKFFPKVAASICAYFIGEFVIAEMIRMNPGKRLHRPSWRGHRLASIALHPVLVEHRSEHRRRRRFCKARSTWKSITHVRGGRKLT